MVKSVRMWWIITVCVSFYVVFFASAQAGSRSNYDLRDINDRQALGDFIQVICAAGWPDIRLLQMLMPPKVLIVDQGNSLCADKQWHSVDNRKYDLNASYSYISEQDKKWLFDLYALIHKDYFNYMSRFKRLDNPRDISTLHRAFATHPYLTARIMASARGPHLGDAWRLLARHMDRILLESNNDEDKRLLAFAMARDNREHDALNIVEEQLRNGDALALEVLPYVALDMPKPIDDDMADMSEPELGYRVVPMLENYLYQHGYPPTFCAWSDGLERGPLKYYVDMVLTNTNENNGCSVHSK